MALLDKIRDRCESDRGTVNELYLLQIIDAQEKALQAADAIVRRLGDGEKTDTAVYFYRNDRDAVVKTVQSHE